MEPLTLGIAGVGTVGGGLLELLATNGAHFANIVGREIRVTGISARSRDKLRSIAVDGFRWFDDPVALAKDPSNNVFIELIGGEDGVAKAPLTTKPPPTE